MDMPTGTEFHSHAYSLSSSSHSPPFLKLEFPKFYGDNPWLWRDQCLMYFEVYGVHESLKTRFTALNFKGTVATWLQTVERRGCVQEWDKLYHLVFEHFDRD